VRGDSKNERTNAAQLAILVAREHRLSVKPAQGQTVVLAEAHQVVGAERKFALADTLRRSLKIGKGIARHLLMRANQQMRELPSGGAGLRQQLGIAVCSSSSKTETQVRAAHPQRRRPAA